MHHLKISLQTIVILLLCLTIAAAGIFLIKERHPEIYYSINIYTGFMENKETRIKEKRRIDSIQLLPISLEKKNILISRTIFMGATTNMVELALGKPLNSNQVNVKHKDGSSTLLDNWIYHFPNDTRSTLLQFENNQLVSAQRISPHRLQDAYSIQ